MQTFHFQSNDEFCIFIEKREGCYFKLCGQGRTPYTPGVYIDAPDASRQMDSLRADGYEERVGTVNP
jgi:hypothetical protein